MELYKNSDVYLFTSQHDAWGLTVAEAAAQKCAIIGRRVGIISELYERDNFVIVNNTKEMIQMTKTLFDNPELLQEFQNRGYETVKSKLSWKNSFHEFESIITSELR